MKPQLQLHFPSRSYPYWCRVTRYDTLAAELADGHYSRQSPGTDQYMPPGQHVAFVHHGPHGLAVWSAVWNVFRDVWRWRNTIYRNVSGTLSSTLVEWATFATYVEWRIDYGSLPEKPLTTEVDIKATSARRSKHNEPGHCYLMAGWRKVRDIPASHGRPAKVELEAPSIRHTFAARIPPLRDR